MIKHINIKGNNKRNKSKNLQQFLNEAKKYPPLTLEEERFANRDLLIKHNMLFAVSVAFRYDNPQVDIMDIISEAMIGLIRAADSYNPSFQNKFISYALFHIQRTIIEFLDIKKNVVHLPHKVQWIKFAMDKYEETDNDTLAKKFKVTDKFIELAKSYQGFVSLDDVNEDGDNIYQIASDEITDKNLIKQEVKEFYNEIIKCLTKRELDILQLRYFDFYIKDLSQIGQSLNISRERVRQIEQQAFQKIRNKYASRS